MAAESPKARDRRARSAEARRPRGMPWKAVAGLAVIAILAAAARFLPLREWVQEFQRWIAGLGFAGVVLFAATYVGGALLLAPVWLLAVVAGLTYSLPAAFALVSALSTLAAGAAFLIARHAARRRVESYARRNPRFAALDRAIAREGWKIVFFLRLSPVVPYAASNYLYGVTAIPFGPYLLASWIGMMPGTLLYLYVGAAGRAALGAGRTRTPAEWIAFGVGLAGTLAVTLWVARIARRELAKSRATDAKGAP